MLPNPIDSEEAANIWREDLTDAARAFLVNFLFTSESLTNKEVRDLLKIKHVYQVTHLKLAGSITEDELLIWDKNPKRITLSHMRAIATLPKGKRKELLENLLVKGISSRKLEQIAKDIRRGNEASYEDIDIKKYVEQVSESIGRPLSIQYDKNKRAGEVTLKFFSIDDLAHVMEMLGHKHEEEF